MSETSFPVTVRLPVQWGDMDAFQHVNNTVYFTWFESARIAYLFEMADEPLSGQAKEGPILATTRCDFKAPLSFPDDVTVSVGVSRVGGKSFTMQLRVVSERSGLAAEGEAVMVWYDYASATPIALPQQVRDAIARIES